MQKITSRKKLVAINESGRRIGESHPLARLSDRDVELIRELHPALSYSQIAQKFEVHKSTIQKIVNYNTRAQFADRWRAVKEVIMRITSVETITAIHPLLPESVLRKTYTFNTGVSLLRYNDGTICLPGQTIISGKVYAEMINAVTAYEEGKAP